MLLSAKGPGTVVDERLLPRIESSFHMRSGKLTFVAVLTHRLSSLAGDDSSLFLN